MDINTTIAQLAASNPRVGMAVAMQGTESAILAGLTAGADPSAASLLGSLYSQESEQAQLLASIQPNLGQNINTLA